MENESSTIGSKTGVTEKDLYAIALENPLIYNTLQAEMRGYFESKTQAFIYCIIELHKQNARLKKMLEEQIHNMAYPDPRLVIKRD
jgi:hypothetical protein